MLEDFGKKIVGFGSSVRQSSKDFTDTVNLKAQIDKCRKEISASFLQLGEEFYNRNAQQPPAEYAGILQQITQLKQEIVRLENEIRTIKGIRTCPRCSCDVGPDVFFCTNCGFSMPPVQKAGGQGPVCCSCGNELREGMLFCTNCGKKIDPSVFAAPATAPSEPNRKICPTCGSSMPMDFRFCEECGTPLPQAAVQEAPAAGNFARPVENHAETSGQAQPERYVQTSTQPAESFAEVSAPSQTAESYTETPESKQESGNDMESPKSAQPAGNYAETSGQVQTAENDKQPDDPAPAAESYAEISEPTQTPENHGQPFVQTQENDDRSSEQVTSAPAEDFAGTSAAGSFAEPSESMQSAEVNFPEDAAPAQPVGSYTQPVEPAQTVENLAETTESGQPTEEAQQSEASESLEVEKAEPEGTENARADVPEAGETARENAQAAKEMRSMFCTRCGAKLVEEFKFCIECGAKVPEA